ncbi:SH2 domain-containing adapter protein F-like isoform X2 [Pocillopora damicornis]|uniref:SH2 domain-containing adapter protein F-like isoform X2 n=1 Tax=Pocillopora damicornis TaxID=46731 RepID=UPI000F551BAA|nr:SH2 domain-containing adapter protein F-like isoform X2 [Pocillopora damicornis]
MQEKGLQCLLRLASRLNLPDHRDHKVQSFCSREKCLYLGQDSARSMFLQRCNCVRSCTSDRNFKKKMPDDYSDPWDAKKAMSPGGDYSDPWDATNTQPGALTDPTKAGRKTSKDDYIDPWDAKEDGKTQVERVTVEKVKHQSNEDSDEESYSEPYDLGKVTLLDEQAKRMSLRGMRPSSVDGTFSEQEENRFRKHSDTGAKKQQSPSRDQRSADDYDSPWESKSFLGMQQKSPNLPQERPQAPVTDTRSSDDYDKPWEWNKNINLNGHTQGPRQQEPVQSPKIDARHPDDYDAPWEWSKSGLTSKVKGPREGEAQGMALVAPSKPPRTFVEDGSPIDPSLPLSRQGWYHGPLKRLEAERLLQSAEDCSFLLRQSESSKNDFSLSVKNNNSFMHLKIVCQGNRYILGQFSKPFNTVPEMIHYYSLNKLNIRGAEHKKLLHPVVPPPEYFTLEPGGYPTAS